MGYNTTITGALLIEPPLKWSEFRGTVYDPDSYPHTGFDLTLAIDEEVVETDIGETKKITAFAIEAPEESGKHYDFEDDLQAMVSKFPGHEFTGFFEGQGEELEDLWRVYVKKGKVKQVKAKTVVTWPEMN